MPGWAWIAISWLAAVYSLPCFLNLTSSTPLSFDRPYLVLQEKEADEAGKVHDCLTVFLTGSTCPIGCKMCDLHHHTFDSATPAGAIPRQIDLATKTSTSSDWIKLYNSGNFFDPRSIPVVDYEAITTRLSGYQRVIIENHPRFGSRRLEEFQSRLSARLEVAVGLETVQPRWLRRLAKQMTRDDFDLYAKHLRRLDVDLRVFLIVGAPGVSVREAIRWAMLSVRHAVLQGARHISLIPARGMASPLSPSNSKFLAANMESEKFFTAQDGDRDIADSSQWGMNLGKIQNPRPQEMFELHNQAIQWAAGRAVITVDPWDLDDENLSVKAIKELNLSQSIGLT